MQQQICGIIEPSGVYVCSRGTPRCFLKLLHICSRVLPQRRTISSNSQERCSGVIYIAYEQFEPQWATGVGSIRIGQQIFAYYFYQQYAQLGIDGARVLPAGSRLSP